MTSEQAGDRPHVELFTDGACKGNPGPGGWAFIVRDVATGAEFEGADGETKTTNNRMELLGVINGLEHIQATTGPARVDLYSDSEYVVKGLRTWMDQWKARGWKRGRNGTVKNLELWQALDELRAVHDVSPNWVRGHDDHPENERCDRLAVAAAEQYAREARNA